MARTCLQKRERLAHGLQPLGMRPTALQLVKIRIRLIGEEQKEIHEVR